MESIYQQVLDFRNMGYGYKSIANLTSVSRDTVVWLCRKYGLTGEKGTRIFKVDTSELKECKFCKQNFNGIGKQIYCSDSCRNKDYASKKIKKPYAIKKCLYCNKDFEAKTWNNKYCSNSCQQKSKHPEQEHSEQKRIRNLKIVEMRKEGKSISEIAEILGKTEGCIGSVCRKYGVGGKLSNKKATHNPNSNPPKKTESDVADFVTERCEGFEYVKGYTGCDGTVDIKCKKCGTICTRSMITIRHNSIRCDECTRREQENKRTIKILAIQRAKLKKEKEKENKFWEQSFDQTSFKECPVCGAFFIGKNKYCSEKCSKHISYNRKDKRFGSRKINYAITAKSLYERDNGICWICKQKCDLNDYVIKKDRNGNDVVICGNNYPSIDHITPVCEGGEDTWSNVRLACRYCNTMRYREAYHAR